MITIFLKKDYKKVIEYLPTAIKKLKQPPSSSIKQIIIAYFLEDSYKKTLKVARQVPDYYFDLRIKKLLLLAAFRTRQFGTTVEYGKKILKGLPPEKKDIKNQTLEMMGIAYFTEVSCQKHIIVSKN